MRNPREILEILQNPREASLRSAPLARRGPVLGQVSQPGRRVQWPLPEPASHTATEASPPWPEGGEAP